MAYWRVLDYYFSQNDLYYDMLRDFILHVNGLQVHIQGPQANCLSTQLQIPSNKYWYKNI